MRIDLTKKAKGLPSKTCRLLISEPRVVSKDRGVPEDDLASWSSGDFLTILEAVTDLSQAAYLPQNQSVPLEHPETGQMQGGYNMAGGS